MTPAFDDTTLSDRGVIAVEGPDALTFLDNVLTVDVGDLLPGTARFAALLTPQGKIIADFHVVRTDAGFLLDVPRVRAADLLNRLTLYRLRAKVVLADRSGEMHIVASPRRGAEGLAFADPRHPGLGWRQVVPAGLPVASVDAAPDGDQARAGYDAARIALGIAEGARDFAYGDTFPHEANLDLVAGVSFTKGCYVGQEVVARMQNKTVVRKRVVRVTAATPLVAGASIEVGAAEIGRIGTVAGAHGLALVRLDRVAEAADKGVPLTSGGRGVTVDADALARYRKSVAERPMVDL